MDMRPLDLSHRLALVLFSPEIIASLSKTTKGFTALKTEHGIPEDAVLIRTFLDERKPEWPLIGFVFQHDSFPASREGEQIREVRPLFTSIHGLCVTCQTPCEACRVVR